MSTLYLFRQTIIILLEEHNCKPTVFAVNVPGCLLNLTGLHVHVRLGVVNVVTSRLDLARVIRPSVYSNRRRVDFITFNFFTGHFVLCGRSKRNTNYFCLMSSLLLSPEGEPTLICDDDVTYSKSTGLSQEVENMDLQSSDSQILSESEADLDRLAT